MALTPTQPVTFNGILLSSVSNFTVLDTDPFRPPARSLVSNQLANFNASAVTSALYKERKVHVIGALQRDGKSGLEQGIRDLQALLQGRNKLLVFNQAGTQTEYTATMSNLAVTERAGGYGEIDIEFICSDPYGYNVTSTTVATVTAHTTNTKIMPYTWSGNVAQLPVITITINSVSLPSSTGTITINNSNAGQTMSIDAIFAAAGSLVINCKTKSVTYNSAAVDFTGPIPEWTGSEEIKYSDNFTARNIDISVTYQQRNI